MVKVPKNKQVKVPLSVFAGQPRGFVKMLVKANQLVKQMRVALNEHLHTDLPEITIVTMKPGLIIREGTSKTSLQCRPFYYGHPRYDFAIAEVEGEDTIVALRCLFEVEVNKNVHRLAGVEVLVDIGERPLPLKAPKHRGRRLLDIIPISALKARSPVVKDNSCEYNDTYFVNSYFEEFEKRIYDPVLRKEKKIKKKKKKKKRKKKKRKKEKEKRKKEN